MTDSIRQVEESANWANSVGRDHGDDVAKYMMYERGVVPWDYPRSVFVSICMAEPVEPPKLLDCERVRQAYEGGKRYAIMSFYDMAVSTV